MRCVFARTIVTENLGGCSGNCPPLLIGAAGGFNCMATASMCASQAAQERKSCWRLEGQQLKCSHRETSALLLLTLRRPHRSHGLSCAGKGGKANLPICRERERPHLRTHSTALPCGDAVCISVSVYVHFCQATILTAGTASTWPRESAQGTRQDGGGRGQLRVESSSLHPAPHGWWPWGSCLASSRIASLKPTTGCVSCGL